MVVGSNFTQVFEGAVVEHVYGGFQVKLGDRFALLGCVYDWRVKHHFICKYAIQRCFIFLCHQFVSGFHCVFYHFSIIFFFWLTGWYSSLLCTKASAQLQAGMKPAPARAVCQTTVYRGAWLYARPGQEAMAYFCLTAWAISLVIVSARSASSGLSITRQLMENGRLMVDVYVFTHF